MVDYTVGNTRPQRTCAACRARQPQAALLRIARRPDGTVAIDGTGARGPGRGAYLCRRAACVAQAEKRRALSRALRGDVPAAIYEELRRMTATGGESATGMG
jgi:predicted RNA-binding protein YlxR (DUF448 family)